MVYRFFPTRNVIYIFSVSFSLPFFAHFSVKFKLFDSLYFSLMMMKLIFLIETRQLYNLLLRGFTSVYIFVGEFYSVDDSLRLILSSFFGNFIDYF